MATEKQRIDNVPERAILMDCIERGQRLARALDYRAHGVRVSIIIEIEKVFDLTLKEEVSNDHAIEQVG